MPLVSILVPVYGVEKYIERCARSVFEQTYPNLEFLFCNDGTPDRSMEILERVIADYPHLHERIHILHHDHNRGLAAARNTLLDHCTGEFLTHVDSDDWVEHDMVEQLVKRQQETDADIVTGVYFKHYIEKEKKVKTKEIALFKDKDREEALKYILQFRSIVALWNRLIRTSLYRDNDVRNVEGINAGEDLLVTPRLIYYSSKIAFSDVITYHYNSNNSDSYSNLVSHSWDIQKQLIKATLLNVDFFKDKGTLYRDAMNKQLTERLKMMLGITLRNRNRQGYNHVLSLLDDTDPKYWPLIGWDKPFNRWLDHHYHLNRLTLPLRRLHGWIYQKTHKAHESPG